MRKFNTVYKEKYKQSEQINENKIINEFKSVYEALLENNNLTSIDNLNNTRKLSFLTELNQYWTEEHGITKLGKSFLEKRSIRLNENSTVLQKKNFLKSKIKNLLKESIRQYDIKTHIYNVLNEMYKQVNGNNIKDVLEPSTISNIITESFAGTLDEFVKDVYYELNKSARPSKTNLNESKHKKKFYIKKRK